VPWRESSPVTERERFIDEYIRREYSVADLCRRFEISRKTAYKWIDRFLSGCELVDRSRRPHSSPRAVAQWLEEAIVAARKQRPRWGPKKLRATLLEANPGAQLPSISTFALIFHRNGLVIPRRRRRSTPPFSAPLAHATGPNSVWCVDFKGHFPVGPRYCYPLTVMDAYSRYLIGCVALRSTEMRPVWRAFEEIFEGFGLPERIRTDNGCPFASPGLCGLSQLSVWWAKLGIRHERIEPGKPQQNGRHERMHLTLKQETAMPPRSTLRGQQRAFDLFRRDYNEIRPHEALGQRPPARFYERSTRVLPSPSYGRDFAYPEDFETTRVTRLGYLPWNGRSVFLSSALAHERVGLRWEHDGAWTLFFGSLKLGRLTGLYRRGKLRFEREERVLPVSLE